MTTIVRHLSGNLATFLSLPWEKAQQLHTNPKLCQSTLQRISIFVSAYFFSFVGAPLKVVALLCERIAPRRVAIIGYGYMGKLYEQLLPSQHFNP